jgi:hypothetical protein
LDYPFSAEKKMIMILITMAAKSKRRNKRKKTKEAYKRLSNLEDKL